MMFNGRKTYVTGILSILGAAGAVVTGEATVIQAVQIGVPALLAMFLRNAM